MSNTQCSLRLFHLCALHMHNLQPPVQATAQLLLQVVFNPKDTSTFASASLDRTVKVCIFFFFFSTALSRYA